jgi:predicted NBD/HSP70 family sugar kinase
MTAPQENAITQVVGFMRETAEKIFGPRTVKLLFLALLALVLPLLEHAKFVDPETAIAGVSVGNVFDPVLLVTGFLLILASIASGLWELRSQAAASQDAASAAQPAVAVLGGSVLIGVEVGRTSVSCGALKMHAVPGDTLDLGGAQTAEIGEAHTRPLRLHESRDELYDDITAALTQVIGSVEKADQHAKIAGIAVSTPSWIDIRAKSLASPVGPFPVSEALADGIAHKLWAEHREIVLRMLQAPGTTIDGAHSLASIIYLDTDSRSAIRYDLHRRLRAGKAWENYSCVLVVEGIGAGLVLNGGVYYGSHSSEGEIGHTTVHLTPQYVMTGGNGLAINTHACDCQLPGVHWETLGGTAGFVNLARSFDPARFAQLGKLLGRELGYADLIDVAAFVHTGGQDAALTRTVREHVRRDQAGYQQYCRSLLREYARIITVGIANMANILDLQHIVIGGSIVKNLDRVQFRNDIRVFWNQYVLRGQRVEYSFEPLDQIWKGAALLFWDPDYLRQVQ